MEVRLFWWVIVLVTFRDFDDKLARQEPVIVCHMNTKAIYLTSCFLLSVSSFLSGDMAASSNNAHASTDGLQLRYKAPGAAATLSVSQDISAGGNASIASRNFLMNFELDEAPGAFAFTINRVKGSYTAHDMTQRLPSSGLRDQTFLLEKKDDNRVLGRTASDENLQVGLGQMVGINYPIGLALVDILPVLPDGPVRVGSTWQSEQETRSLEGWAWAEGRLVSAHEVTAVDQKDGHTIVSISSEGQARLSKVEGGLDYSGAGDLSRSSNWLFDVTDGRLLSLTMKQETVGINTLPQGDVDIRQLTTVEFSARDQRPVTE
jgi:hypothetical protein